MEQKEIKINCPEGFEIDKENSTFECIKFKPIKKELPKSWEEYCKTHRSQCGESWVDDDSNIKSIDSIGSNYCKDVVKDRNLLPSKELTEAMLALCQLIQLRDCYNDGWTPDWNEDTRKYYIYSLQNNLTTDSALYIQRVLSFKTDKLRDQFLENFRDLIEIAKPLL